MKQKVSFRGGTTKGFCLGFCWFKFEGSRVGSELCIRTPSPFLWAVLDSLRACEVSVSGEERQGMSWGEQEVLLPLGKYVVGMLSWAGRLGSVY